MRTNPEKQFPGNQLSRRGFLQSIGVGALAPLVLPGSVLGRDGGIAPSERITVGMIGVGNQGNRHLGILLGMPDAQVVAVCDPVRGKREATKPSGEMAPTTPGRSKWRAGPPSPLRGSTTRP